MANRSDGIPLYSVSTDQLSHERDGSALSLEDHENTELRPSYAETQEDVLPPYEQETTAARIHSAPLDRNLAVLIPTAVYCAMAIWSWVTLYKLSLVDEYTTDFKHKKARSYKAAQVLRFIVVVATVPILSAICASAASGFVQRQRQGNSLRLRQVMTLADRSWINPFVYVRMLFYDSGFKRYGSSFLYLATIIHILGIVTYPIQSLFLSARQVNVLPVDSEGYVEYSSNLYNVATVQNMIDFKLESQIAQAIVTVRSELQADGVNGEQSQLWGSTNTLSNYASDTSWFAELSNNITTGVWPDQYIPRVNSSVEILDLSVDEFPSDCSTTSNWFYAHYTYSYLPSYSYYNATIEVCLPMDGAQSPWSANNDRQDFTETLYVNISGNYSLEWSEETFFGAFKIVANTTVGLFRLPSLKNQTAGPLENSSQCIGTCGSYTHTPDYKTRRSSSISSRRGRPYGRQSDEFSAPALPGPLTTVAVALFGSGSFPDLQQTVNYSLTNTENALGWNGWLDEQLPQTLAPLENFGLHQRYDENYAVFTWILEMTDVKNRGNITSALNQACFLATKALWDGFVSAGGTISFLTWVRADVVQTTTLTLPSLSRTGMIVGSVLLALYLIPSLCLAIWAAASRRWTDTLDAFTMLRMGAAVGQQELPLLVGKKMHKIQVLDDWPGVVRDVSGPDDKIRQLALGIEGGAPLEGKGRYLAYAGNSGFRTPRPAHAYT
ncbi:uncharacterized protein BHQ10_003736 [Talaromyces amestolkiae]|uniref:Uncharacterized protein n=1 Tax=Talaromyces amestolkiae TaxID=1196081 RepID=A0A364KW00_TALAM|nr:uncharacterized protein BHQ10_003736 [Talaromyces amestolkiae]RAO67724.1 hypothetical protein BHQ10_003736 [Talaromyces amestolkiae]